MPVLDSTSHHLDISQDDYEPATYSALDCTEGQLLSLKQKYVRQFQQFKQEHLRGANSRLLRLDKIIQHTAELNQILSSATSITGQTGQDQSGK